MAFKLTKKEDVRKAEIEANLESIVGKVEDAKTELQDNILKLIDEFNANHVAPLNEALEEARNFVEDIHRERQEDYDSKSERWTEGEKGQAAYDWLNSWESALTDLEEVMEMEAPTIDFDIPDAHNAVQQLEGEASE